MRKQRGITLIELMVILAMIGIVVGFGVPQISSIIQNNRIISSLNNLSAHLSYARSEAVKRSTNVSVAPLNAADWMLGWQVFVDPNASGAIDQPADLQLRIVDNLNIPNVTIIPTGNFVSYDRFGVSIDRLPADPVAAERFVLADPPNPNRTLSISKTGHVRNP